MAVVALPETFSARLIHEPIMDLIEVYFTVQLRGLYVSLHIGFLL